NVLTGDHLNLIQLLHNGHTCEPDGYCRGPCRVSRRKPITGIVGYCARAAIGQVAAVAPPSSVMNSRRLIIRSPRRHVRAASAVSRLFSGCDVGAQRMWPRQAPATRREVPLPVSIGDEAVDQTGATSRLQLILTATARAMRGVPRLHVPGGL